MSTEEEEEEREKKKGVDGGREPSYLYPQSTTVWDPDGDLMTQSTNVATNPESVASIQLSVLVMRCEP